MLPLFFYGTLMDAEVRALMLGRPIDVAPARLRGYRRVPVAGRPYPTLLISSNDCVDGVLAREILPEELKRLIAYEGAEYLLNDVQVLCNEGGLQDAQAFLTRPGIAISAHLDWTLGDWQRRHKRRLLSRTPAPR